MFESHQSEKGPRMMVLSPAIETLQSLPPSPSLWPKAIQFNPERIHQAEAVGEIRLALEELYTLMPLITKRVEEYPKTEEVERVTNAFYNTCTNYLARDPLHARLVLYLPFELIPPNNPDQEVSNKQSNAAHSFRKAFLQAWQSLLETSELRADYLDGDILEAEIRTEPLPKVVKAAHLIPKLVERDLLDIPYVISLLEESTDLTLKNSIADACMVLSDMEAFTEEHLKRMMASTDSYTSNIAKIIKAERIESSADTEKIMDDQGDFDTVNTDFLHSIESYTDKIQNSQDLSDRRKSWLLAKYRDEKIHTSAQELLALIEAGSLRVEDAFTIIHDASYPEHVHMSIVQALEYFIESTHYNDELSAESIIRTVLPQMVTLYRDASPSLQSVIEKSIFHLHSLHIIDTHVLADFNLSQPNLAPNGQEIMRDLQEDIAALTDACTKIESHPELQEYVYPVIITTGSAMKGYQSKGADLDIVVFIKPNVAENKRGRIQDLLKEVLVGTRADSAMEFWLYEDASGYAVRDYIDPDPQRGDSSLTHPLTGVWCGNEKAISELYTKLMPGYVYSKNKKILDFDAREVWLRDIEHNTLKYRLMHKGYARFNAPQGGINSNHADDIDGTSMFYDSGYRRLATTSFIKNVFLPQLTEEPKL